MSTTMSRSPERNWRQWKLMDRTGKLGRRMRIVAAPLVLVAAGVLGGVGIGRATAVSKTRYASLHAIFVKEQANAAGARDQARAEALRANQLETIASHTLCTPR
jgi:hypothetical protein